MLKHEGLHSPGCRARLYTTLVVHNVVTSVYNFLLFSSAVAKWVPEYISKWFHILYPQTDWGAGFEIMSYGCKGFIMDFRVVFVEGILFVLNAAVGSFLVLVFFSAEPLVNDWVLRFNNNYRQCDWFFQRTYKSGIILVTLSWYTCWALSACFVLFTSLMKVISWRVLKKSLI